MDMKFAAFCELAHQIHQFHGPKGQPQVAADILSSRDADNASRLVDYIISMWSSAPPSAKNFLFPPDWGLSRSSFRQAVRHFLLLSDKTAIHDQAYADWLQQFQLTQTVLEVIPATPSAPFKPSAFFYHIPTRTNTLQ